MKENTKTYTEEELEEIEDLAFELTSDINLLDEVKDLELAKQLLRVLIEERNEMCEVLEELANEKDYCVTAFIEMRGKVD